VGEKEQKEGQVIPRVVRNKVLLWKTAEKGRRKGGIISRSAINLFLGDKMR